MEISNYEDSARELEASATDKARSLGPSDGPAPGDGADFEAIPQGRNLEFQGGVEIRQPVNPPEHQIDAEIKDYQQGEYLLDKAPYSKTVIAAVAYATSDYLRKHPGTRASALEIIGNADGIPVLRGALYRGDLGSFRDFPYHSLDRNRVETMELISGETELDNEKIAFLRAYNALEKFGPLPGLGKAEQAIATKTNHEVSGSFRRVIVRVTLENALDDRYSELSPPSRWIVNWRQSKQRVVSLEKVNK